MYLATQNERGVGSHWERTLGAIWEPTRSPSPFQATRHQPIPLI